MILDDLCCDIIIGHDIIREHEKLVINFGAQNPLLKFRESHDSCAMRSNKIEPFPLFAYQMYSKPEVQFIDFEIARLHKAGIIEPSNMSPWRAQVLFTSLDKAGIIEPSNMSPLRAQVLFTSLDKAGIIEPSNMSPWRAQVLFTSLDKAGIIEPSNMSPWRAQVLFTFYKFG